MLYWNQTLLTRKEACDLPASLVEGIFTHEHSSSLSQLHSPTFQRDGNLQEEDQEAERTCLPWSRQVGIILPGYVCFRIKTSCNFGCD